MCVCVFETTVLPKQDEDNEELPNIIPGLVCVGL